MDRKDQRATELAQALDDLEDAFLEPPPERRPKPPQRKAWQPRLGRVGTEVLLNRTSKTKFLYGERGSLKTGAALNDLVLHCWGDFQDGKMFPLAVICVIVRAAATEGGAWEKLNSLYLPEWYDGLGLDFTDPRMDDQKNRYVFVGNKVGGWSRIVLKSIPHGESIKGRLKGVEPSYFFFDEITDTKSSEYYTVPIQGLRRPTGGPRQYVCAGNPPDAGEDHWSWKVIVEGAATSKDEDGNPVVNLPHGGGRLGGLHEDTAVYHVPITDNVYWSQDQIRENQDAIMKEAILDPTVKDRLIHGLWVAKPSGEGIFRHVYIPSIHIRGNRKRNIGLKPVAGFPFIIGYDLGQTFNSSTFLQRIFTRKKAVWTVFDEVDHLGERIIYATMAKEILGRIKYWSLVLGYPFEAIHIADKSAIDQWRPGGDGSYDAWEFEKEFNKVRAQEGKPPIKMLGAEQTSGSVKARLNMTASKLAQEELFISALCKNSTDMFRNLESEKNDPDKPKRSKWIHKYDSLSYPIWRFEMRGYTGTGLKIETPPQLTFVGSES